MTEAEKLAEEYTAQKIDYDIERIRATIKLVYDNNLKEAFLAGYKTGQLKWHKVADGILPDNYRYVWTNVGAGYYDDECWYDDFGRLQGVVSWCEPEFKEVEK